jgi:hypothetical protein
VLAIFEVAFLVRRERLSQGRSNRGTQFGARGHRE